MVTSTSATRSCVPRLFIPQPPALRLELTFSLRRRQHSIFDKPDFRSASWSAFGYKERVHLMSASGDQIINNGKSSVVVAFVSLPSPPFPPLVLSPKLS